MKIQPEHVRRAAMDEYARIQKLKLWVVLALIVLNVLVRL